MKPIDYINKLQKAINQSDSFSIVSTEECGDLVDIMVKDKKGEDIFIKMRDAKTYGQLPLATSIILKDVKDKHPRVLLVSFSRIEIALQEIFTKMGVYFLIKPSVEDTTRKLTEIAG
jgi:hypothetical protein